MHMRSLKEMCIPVSTKVIGNSVGGNMGIFFDRHTHINICNIYLFQKREGEDNGQDSDEGSTAGGWSITY